VLTSKLRAHKLGPLRNRLRPWRYHLAVVPVISVALVLLAVALLEGDLPEEFGDLTGWVSAVLQHFGAVAAVGLLYVEESGVPMPVPGDVFVVYLGALSHGSIAKWLVAWLAVVVVAVLGSSNLYVLAHRFGPRLMETRLGALLHVDERRLSRAEEWFRRWGALAVIFGRHIPGFRIPVTVIAGTLRFPYRSFAPSVAVSTALWSAVWLWLGAQYGSAVGSFFVRNRWVLIAAGIAVVLALAVVVVNAWISATDSAALPDQRPVRNRPGSAAESDHLGS
jgi:membrane-associated protein